MVSRNLAWVAALAAVGCAGSPKGLRATPEGTGPLVVVDWDAEPLPEIPFPNDLAARTDPTSITGLRLNISKLAVTQRERDARTKLDELTGFGVFAPISVSFEAPLDLDEIVARHPNDLQRPERFDDDAFYLIDVDPRSPHYLEPVDLDVGHGRYPVDVEGVGSYFANDPRAADPTVLFESSEEDLNGNGVLDWGEDTDNDGILDHPNVYPFGGDPRADLLTFYERQTNTLIVRPVVPLREESTYAMVLTERLIGEDGEPVRSPWEYVNHTRQTEALEPVLQALPNWGLTVDDVAYAWVFSTGRQTGDLVDVRRGLVDGEGPYPFLRDDFAPSVYQAAKLHDLADYPSEYLPADTFVDAITGFGALGAPETEALLGAAYVQYGGALVGGAFVTPYLMADADDGGADDTDEWWHIDPVRHSVFAGAQRVPFSCVLPKETATVQPPYSVMFYGHGHGSTRLEMLLFGWAANRMGIAACGIDYPGHGPDISPEERDLFYALLDAQGLGPALEHFEDSRQRDLTNDGRPDSGADQWVSDPFHSRDMVRQGVVDWIQFVRALKTCGTGEMTIVGADQVAVGSTVSCDWDEDGNPDLGGPNAKFYLAGGSLGGIDSAVAAAVMPEATATASIVPGGGLLDVGIRSDLSGVVAAVLGRMLTPLILGLPTGDGNLQIVQVVNQYLSMQTVTIATVPMNVGGGKVRIENLDNGVVREGYIPPDGAFRLAIPADAPSGIEKRILVGMPDTGPGTEVYSVDGNVGLGDRLVITLYDQTSAEVVTIDAWQDTTVYEGITYEAGSPLVAASHGLGHIRGTPDFRRLIMATALAMEPGDPVTYAPHYQLEPFDALGGKPVNILIQPGIGDQGVTISAGIALARAAGLIGLHDVDDRYGMTVDQWLIDREVLHGLEAYGPYTDSAGTPLLFDPDNLDLGADGSGAPSDIPLRATRASTSGVAALRLSYPSPQGRHGFDDPNPNLPFDAAIYAGTSIGWYIASDGTEVRDDPCMGTANGCVDIPAIVLPEDSDPPTTTPPTP